MIVYLFIKNNLRRGFKPGLCARSARNISEACRAGVGRPYFVEPVVVVFAGLVVQSLVVVVVLVVVIVANPVQNPFLDILNASFKMWIENFNKGPAQKKFKKKIKNSPPLILTSIV